jgi:hypothetical protein
MATLTINGTTADDTIVVTATGADSGSYSINGGPAVAFSGVTQLAVTGGAGNDTLTIANPTGGLFAPVNGISYDGGGQPADSLEIMGGVATQLTYTAGATPDAGTLMYAGAAGTQTIGFAGIAPITDTVAAATLVIKGTAGKDVIEVTDGGLVNGQQTTQVSAATFESIRFANKTTVTIDGNGDFDTLSFNNPTVAAGLIEMDVTNVGAITQTGAVNYTNLSLNNVGLVGLNGNNDVTNLAANVTVPGTFFAFHDVDDITLTSVGGVNGISATGSIFVTTANGAITVVDTAAAADINAATSADLVAGSVGAADFAVQLSAGANVTGATGARLKGDNIDIATGATVNAGTGVAFLETFSMGAHIDLGGADGVNTLGLTDTELDAISAGTLHIGDGTAGTISFVSQVAPAGVNQLELHTGADIQDNNAGTDVMVARLTLNAFTGIGVTGASTGIDTDVALLEGQTGFGGMNISNAGAVTVGGVSDNFLGLWVFGSGDLTLTAGGTIDLADRNGAAAVHGGSQGGNVFLSANGAAADIVRTDGADAIMAQAGNVTAVAGRDIVLGTGSVSPRTDVEADGSVTLSAGRDITVSGQGDIVSDHFGHNTGGSVTATAGRNISLGGFATIGADGNAGGDVVLATGVNGLLTVGSIGLGGRSLYSNSGDLTVNADRLAISAVSDIAAAQSVTLQAVSSARAIDLGSFTDLAASTLEISNLELSRISTPTLRIGSTAMTGDLTVSQEITADGHYDTLSLRTGGGIVDGVAGPSTQITVDNLALRAATGIGHSDFIRVAVSNLAFSNSGTGDVNLVNASSLTLAAVDGLTASSEADGLVQVNSNGAMTVATNVTASGLINLIAEDTPGAGDDITVLAGTSIQSTNGVIQLGAGDNVITQAGSVLQSPDLVVIYVERQCRRGRRWNSHPQRDADRIKHQLRRQCGQRRPEWHRARGCARRQHGRRRHARRPRQRRLFRRQRR